MAQQSKVILVQEPPTYRHDPLLSAVVCQRCGALVEDQETHSNWHVSLTVAIHHLADGIIGLFSTQPGGEELIAEVEAEQRQAAKKDGG